MKKKKPFCTSYANGTKHWYLNGWLHREDGPAVEYVNGSKEWWLNGKEYTKQAYYEELVKRGKITLEDVWIHLL